MVKQISPKVQRLLYFSFFSTIKNEGNSFSSHPKTIHFASQGLEEFEDLFRTKGSLLQRPGSGLNGPKQTQGLRSKTGLGAVRTLLSGHGVAHCWVHAHEVSAQDDLIGTQSELDKTRKKPAGFGLLQNPNKEGSLFELRNHLTDQRFYCGSNTTKITVCSPKHQLPSTLKVEFQLTQNHLKQFWWILSVCCRRSPCSLIRI